MQSDLVRLCYTSRACLAPAAQGVHQIAKILDESRAWNEQVGITGVLLFNRGQFAQVLEGPASAVENIFDAIKTDRRHERVIRLDWQLVNERAFGEWSMCFVGTDPDGVADFGALHPYEPDHPVDMRDRMLTLLLSLVTRWEQVTPSASLQGGAGR